MYEINEFSQLAITFSLPEYGLQTHTVMFFIFLVPSLVVINVLLR